MRRITAAVLSMTMLSGCSPGMYELLTRTFADPHADVPSVESLEKSRSIQVRWERDEGADEYVLERAMDREALAFQVVYRGVEAWYTDNELEEGRYLYRLSKRRGRELFGPWGEAMGVSSALTRDKHRNRTKEEAIELTSLDRQGSIYYFRTYGGQELAEEDWYYIDIPPLWQAAVVVNDAEVLGAGSASHLMRLVEGRESAAVIHLQSFWIENYEAEKTRYYIKLYPAPLQFVGGGVPGGKIVRYKISLQQMSPVQIGG